MNTTLMVLAAGIGSRYGGLKQMDPVGPGGEFILDYSVYDAIRAGFDRIVFVVSEKIEEAFKATIGERIAKHVTVEYVRQALDDLPQGFTVPEGREKPWGTAHAIYAGRAAVDTPFGVINADDFYGRESYELLAQHLSSTAADATRFAMVGYRLSNTVSLHGSVARGVCQVDEHNRLTDVVERTRIEAHRDSIHYRDARGIWHDISGDARVSMNLWGFKPSFFDALTAEFGPFLEQHGSEPKAEFFAPSVVNTMIKSGQASVDVLSTDSAWFGVTYPDDKPRVITEINALVGAGEYPRSLWG